MSQLESSLVRGPIDSNVQICRNSQKLLLQSLTKLVEGCKTLEKQATAAAGGGGGAPGKTGGSAAKKTSSKTKAASDADANGDDIPLTPALRASLSSSLSRLLSDTLALRKKVADSSTQAQAASAQVAARLDYLVALGRKVDQAAQRERKAMQDGETTSSEEEENEEQVDQEGNGMEDVAPPSHSPSPSPPPTRSRPSRRNARSSNAMEEDEEEKGESNSHKSARTDNAATPAPSLHLSTSLRLDRLCGEHLLRTGRLDTVSKLIADRPQLAPLLDTQLMAQLRKLQSTVERQHDLTRAIAWCGEQRSRLAKFQQSAAGGAASSGSGSALEFEFRLHQCIALARQKKQKEAVEYARKFLAEAALAQKETPPAATSTQTSGNAASSSSTTTTPTRNNQSSDAKTEVQPPKPSVVPEFDPPRLRLLQEALNMIVCDVLDDDDEEENSTTTTAASSPSSWKSTSPFSRYHVYRSPQRWDSLALLLRSTFLALNGVSSAASTLEAAMAIGLAATKTNTCNGAGHDQSNGVHSSPLALSAPPPSCPCCISPFSTLSSSLPPSSRRHSRLVCRLNGSRMDADNPPMALPNGQVFSRRALRDMATENGGIITCPVTGQKFTLEQCKQLYIL